MKQKFFMRLVAVASVLLLSAATATAHDFEVNGIFYTILGEGWSVSVTFEGNYYDASSNEYSGAVTIPAKVTYSGKTYSVTLIGKSAFEGCYGLTSVEIPNSVTKIYDNAFCGCYGLTSVSIGNSVTYIGKLAFAGCGLTSVEIPSSVTYIGYDAFRLCTELKKVEISDLEAWCKISFYNGYVNDGNANPTSYSHHLFLNGHEIKNLIIPETVQELKFAAFYGCSGLKSVVIPNSVTSISESAFEGCSGLKSVSIGNSVTSIGEEAFSDCSGLTSLVIPNSVTKIDYSAFYGCSGLTSLVIPNSVTKIRDSSFSNCRGLKSITVKSGNTVYDSRDNCNAIINTATNCLICGCKNTIIPNSVTGIGRCAFYGCRGLKSVVIPNSVTSIGDYAFYDCI